VKSREPDTAYALRLLASGQSIDDVWKEAGYASRKALADDLYRLADRVAGEPGVVAVAGRRAPAGRGRKKAGGGALEVIAYSDGASIGNPGPAGCGVVILDQTGQVLLEDYRYLGEATNNVAEYKGALLAVTRARELGARSVELKVDSELVANQIRGGYRVKSPNLARLHHDLKQIAQEFEQFEVTQVARGENKQADKLANLAIASRRT
jgi:ribonuclease HI